MSAPTKLLVLGMLLFCIGVLYQMCDILITDHLLAKFYVETPYMVVMGIQWNLIPTILYFLTLMCILFAGLSRKRVSA